MSKGIIDNKQTGLVGDVIKEYITKGSKLSVAAAHFTLYAFVELKKELSQLEEFRFIFTEPAFVQGGNLLKEQMEKKKLCCMGLKKNENIK